MGKVLKQARDRLIILDPHALDRWNELVGPVNPKAIRGEVRKHLRATLQGTGLPADTSGRSREPADQGFLLTLRKGDESRPGLHAVVKPEAAQWVVVTFHIGEKMRRKVYKGTEVIRCEVCGSQYMLIEGDGFCPGNCGRVLPQD